MNVTVTVNKIENGFLVIVNQYEQNDYNDYSPANNSTKQYFAPNPAELGNIIMNAFAS